MIYQQTFTIDADGVKKDNVTNIIPCSISSAAYDGYNNYQPTPAEGDEATRILGKSMSGVPGFLLQKAVLLLQNITVIMTPRAVLQIQLLQIAISLI